MGALLGARGRKVGSIYGGITGGQGPGSRIDKSMKALLGARGRKVGLIGRGIVGVLLM